LRIIKDGERIALRETSNENAHAIGQKEGPHLGPAAWEYKADKRKPGEEQEKRYNERVSGAIGVALHHAA